MPCYHPLTAYRSKAGRGSNGKWPLVFNRNEGYIDLEMKIPCGKCIGCRLEHSRQWAIRAVHEASMYDKNCYLTLTYNEENVPKNGSLNKRDIQLFLKKLRESERRKGNSDIRYFQCGEYGEEKDRPHHHAILFNFDFEDKKYWKSKNGFKLYRSDYLESLWKHGNSIIGSVTFESCAYVARYITKKISGPKAEEHYKGKVPEFTTMSRRPGIGAPWLYKYANDVFSVQGIVIRGRIMKPAKYYDVICEKINDMELKKMLVDRKKYITIKKEENLPWRLAPREKVQEQKASKLIRTL